MASVCDYLGCGVNVRFCADHSVTVAEKNKQIAELHEQVADLITQLTNAQVCGVTLNAPQGMYLACAYAPGHEGDHSWEAGLDVEAVQKILAQGELDQATCTLKRQVENQKTQVTNLQADNVTYRTLVADLRRKNKRLRKRNAMLDRAAGAFPATPEFPRISDVHCTAWGITKKGLRICIQLKGHSGDHEMQYVDRPPDTDVPTSAKPNIIKPPADPMTINLMELIPAPAWVRGIEKRLGIIEHCLENSANKGALALQQERMAELDGLNLEATVLKVGSLVETVKAHSAGMQNHADRLNELETSLTSVYSWDQVLHERISDLESKARDIGHMKQTLHILNGLYAEHEQAIMALNNRPAVDAEQHTHPFDTSRIDELVQRVLRLEEEANAQGAK